MKLKSLFVSCLCCLTLFCNAQITSATLKGSVQDTQQETLIGATIQATHLPTGTRYGTTTLADGTYILQFLKSGGPYRLACSYIGYATEIREDIYLELGKTSLQTFRVRESAELLESVEVIYDKNDPFQSRKKGASTNLDEATIQQLPSLNRGLQDVTRLSPNGSGNAFAGTNYRFNNLSIDGASNNDVLGFQEPASGAGGSVASGTPGALAGTQPISLDAVQEVQVAIAPFDVRFGNFTGANLNVVTKNGTNTWQGTIYGVGRNQSSTGKSIDEERSRLDAFYDTQAGLSIGGPLIKNKLFVFANYDMGRRQSPVLAVPGTLRSNIPRSVAQAVSDTLQSRYGYFPGSFEETAIQRRNDKFFLRFDYNLSPKHQLALRHNIVRAKADNLERSERILTYEGRGFTHNSTTNSTVLELKSQLSNSIANHLIVGYNVVEDFRDYDGRVFPHIEINYNTSNSIFVGSYREASIYGLTLNTSQITNNLSIYKNKHQITLGTSNELYQLEYRFLTAWNGRWEYRSVEDFFNNQPRRIRGVYNYGDNSFEFNRANPSADFAILLPSVYLQDDYQWTEKLSVSLGLRLDAQFNLSPFPLSDAVKNTPEFSDYSNQISRRPTVNPRLGFNYTISDAAQVRGGLGAFTGRIPFAWYAYPHYISGINYGNIDIKPNEPLALEEDLSALRSLQPDLTEINLVDNGFKLPRQVRANAALDWKLPNQFFLTLEGVYSKTLQGILFQSLNLKPITERYEGADSREFYSSEDRKINPNFTNVFLLTNTDKGHQYQLSASIRKQINKQFNLFAAYTYGESKDLVNGVRNSMAANFNVNQAVFSNQPDLAYSNFDIRHRLVANANWVQTWNEQQHSFATLIFNGQSGSPFSYIVAGDVDRDGSSRNDLVYVPTSSADIQFADIMEDDKITISAAEQWQQFNAFIEQDAYLSSLRGNYSERNGGRTPWNFNLDARLAHQWHFANSQQLELTLDIFNVLNLLSYKWGKQYFVPNVSNSSYQLLELDGVEDGQPIYQFKSPNAIPWQVDPLASRWQAQLGLRYRF